MTTCLYAPMPQHLPLPLHLPPEAEEGAFPLRIVGLGGHGDVTSVALLPDGRGQFAQVLQPLLQRRRRAGLLGQQDLPERVDLFPAAHVCLRGDEPARKDLAGVDGDLHRASFGMWAATAGTAPPPRRDRQWSAAA